MIDITGLGSAFEFGKGIMDRFWPPKATEEEKLNALKGIVPMIQNRDVTIAEAKKEIIVAEMQQGDNYTKRARPSVVYMGLIFIGLVHVIVPTVANTAILLKASLTTAQIAALANLSALSLPTEFWAAWTAVVGIWSIGRSVERRGFANKIISAITGSK